MITPPCQKTCLDFVFFEPDRIVAELGAAGFGIVEQTCRAPYDASVEAQTDRCYVLAKADSAGRGPGSE